ncbi:hypothetical protein BH18VER1_BH18VER1_18260 [soil metagenome]
MNNTLTTVQTLQRRSFKSAFFVSMAAAFALLCPALAYANHPVVVEGNCNNPPAGNPAAVTPGTCGDYDGDGLIGTAEDADGDRVFGTINGANAASATGVNNNGTITIVTSGTFAEQVTLTGNITLQAAPGVDANIDAVLQGDADSTPRQDTPGIIVNAPSNRRVVIRNISTRNWSSGIQVNGQSRVSIERCRVEHNVNYGIEVNDSAAVQIDKTEVLATGFRINSGGVDFPTTSTPAPGVGISFEDSSRGSVYRTTVTGSFRAGLRDISSGNVKQMAVYLFDNNPGTGASTSAASEFGPDGDI